MTERILYQVKDSIATITLNTPENLNAMDETMAKAFTEIIKKLKNDKNIRVAILTGAGRAFSSGGNLEMIESKFTKDEKTNARELKEFYQSFLQVRELKIPVIAAINGHAMGAGLCLALACDLRYASETAKLGANFARIGLSAGMGGTYLITRLAGSARAAEIMMIADVVSAQKASEIGLINDVYKADELMSRVNVTAETIARNGPIPLDIIKQGIQKAQHATLEEMFDYDSEAQAKCFLTKDIQEGIAAVREKRQPNFKGV